MSRESIREWQTQRARRLVRWANQRLPFYKKHWHGRDLDDVWSLPAVSKKDLMQNLVDATTLRTSWAELAAFREQTDQSGDFDRLYRGRYNVELSSGTSGSKGLFVFSPQERLFYRAMVAARNGLPSSLRKIRAVLILRVDSPAFHAINSRRIQLHYLSLDVPIHEMVGQLNELRPNVLAGQPWVLKKLGCERRSKRLKLDLQAVIPVAEVLEPQIREEIQSNFNAPIREIYQASEGYLAASCEHGRLHLNEDIVVVQFDDRPPGESDPSTLSRQMTITELLRRTQPIIRYRLDDMVELDMAPCPCGSNFRVIKQIHGRADDVIWGQLDGGQWRPIFPDYFRRAIVRAADAIAEYQLYQVAPDRLVLRIEVEGVDDHESLEQVVRSRLSEVFRRHGCRNCNVEIIYGEPELTATSRKLRRIVSQIKTPP
jgi:phenylacetate-CoA ligase